LVLDRVGGGVEDRGDVRDLVTLDIQWRRHARLPSRLGSQGV
jgi:hypothetical protein